MKAKIISIKESQSTSHPGNVIWIFFKAEDGKSYRTYLSRFFGNWDRWMAVMEKFRREEVWLDNLRVLNEKKKLLDADSLFTALGV